VGGSDSAGDGKAWGSDEGAVPLLQKAALFRHAVYTNRPRIIAKAKPT